MKTISFISKYDLISFEPHIDIYIDGQYTDISITPMFFEVNESSNETYIRLVDNIMVCLKSGYHLSCDEINQFYDRILNIIKKEGMIIQSF